MLLAALCAWSLLAGQAASEAAAAAKARGDAAMVAGEAAQALSAYEEAYRLNPTAALLYNQARAQERLGRYAPALTLLERFAAEAEADVKAKVPALGELLRVYRGRTCQLFLDVEPDRAEVRLDGQLLGVSPLPQPLIVEAGLAEIAVSGLTDYFPASKKVPLTTGPVHVSMVLLSRLRGGVLRVTAPEGSEVVLDEGVARGPPPLEDVVLPGLHSVKVTKEGFDPFGSSVVVKPGELKLVDVELKKEPAFYERWYFWTPIAAAVVAGVATAVAFSIERPPPLGSLNEPGRPLPTPFP